MTRTESKRKWLMGAALAGAGALAGAAGFAVHRFGSGAGSGAPAGSGSASLDGFWNTPFKDLAGQPVKLSQFKGQPMVLNFWASWCGPCLEEMPDFQRASQTEAGKRVKFVGIGIDYARNMQPFADKLGITYTLIESGAQGLDLVKAAGNTSGALPFTLILDRSGTPVTRKLGKMDYAELMGAIGKL